MLTLCLNDMPMDTTGAPAPTQAQAASVPLVPVHRRVLADRSNCQQVAGSAHSPMSKPPIQPVTSGAPSTRQVAPASAGSHRSLPPRPPQPAGAAGQMAACAAEPAVAASPQATHRCSDACATKHIDMKLADGAHYDGSVSRRHCCRSPLLGWWQLTVGILMCVPLSAATSAWSRIASTDTARSSTDTDTATLDDGRSVLQDATLLVCKVYSHPLTGVSFSFLVPCASG